MRIDWNFCILLLKFSFLLLHVSSEVPLLEEEMWCSSRIYVLIVHCSCPYAGDMGIGMLSCCISQLWHLGIAVVAS